MLLDRCLRIFLLAANAMGFDRWRSLERWEQLGVDRISWSDAGMVPLDLSRITESLSARISMGMNFREWMPRVSIQRTQQREYLQLASIFII
jgi:hypothetical protein